MVEFNNNTLEFIHSWSERIDYINTSMRSIKRVQADCYLLEKYMNNKANQNE